MLLLTDALSKTLTCPTSQIRFSKRASSKVLKGSVAQSPITTRSMSLKTQILGQIKFKKSQATQTTKFYKLSTGITTNCNIRNLL